MNTLDKHDARPSLQKRSLLLLLGGIIVYGVLPLVILLHLNTTVFATSILALPLQREMMVIAGEFCGRAGARI